MNTASIIFEEIFRRIFGVTTISGIARICAVFGCVTILSSAAIGAKKNRAGRFGVSKPGVGLVKSGVGLKKPGVGLRKPGAVEVAKQLYKLEVAPTSQQIAGLKWNNSNSIPVAPEMVNGTFQNVAILKGSYTQEGGLLFQNDRPVRIAPDRTFEVKVAVKLGSYYKLRSVSALGVAEVQTFSLVPVTPEKVSRASSNKRFWITASAGYAYVNYQEAADINLVESTIAAKVAFSYMTAPRAWHFGLSSGITVAPISSNIANSARFFNIDTRIGYSLPIPYNPWELVLISGIYYTTMFTDGNFGFQDLMGPQIVPVVRYRAGKVDSVSGSIKFCPVGSGVNLQDLGNHETAANLEWKHALPNGQFLTLAADAAFFHFISEGREVASTIYSISLGYGL